MSCTNWILTLISRCRFALNVYSTGVICARAYFMSIRPFLLCDQMLGSTRMHVWRDGRENGTRRSVKRGGCVCARVNVICKPSIVGNNMKNEVLIIRYFYGMKWILTNTHMPMIIRARSLTLRSKRERNAKASQPNGRHGTQKQIVWRKTQTFLHADCIHFNRRHNPADVSRLPRMRLLRSDDILSNENGEWRKVLCA